jgi:hypothetical protein
MASIDWPKTQHGCNREGREGWRQENIPLRVWVVAFLMKMLRVVPGTVGVGEPEEWRDDRVDSATLGDEFSRGG